MPVYPPSPVRLASTPLLLLLATPLVAGADPYFPLRVGNWWTYEEQDDDGHTLARETWTVIEAHDRGEFHLRSRSKRLDGLGSGGVRWEGHEYFRQAADGLHKRYPAGREAELEVVLLKAPTRSGTRWRDAQGVCEVMSDGTACLGPRGEHPDCVTIVCRLGEPAATIVRSTYARDVGMVQQEVRVLQLAPTFTGGDLILPTDPSCGGRSVLRLTGYSVGRD
jgi:hypothetical protein